MGKQSKIWLSKSTILKSIQCDKALYLYKNNYLDQDKISPRTQQLFTEGRSIESIAREQLFPGGIDLSPKSPLQWSKVATLTKRLIQNQQPYIYEAAFVSDGVLCAVDVLQVVDTNRIIVYEIKRGASVKDVYLTDISIQYAIIKQLGYEIESAVLVQPKSLEDDELSFHLTNCIEICVEQEAIILQQIQHCKEILSKKQPPNIQPGEQCHSPYECSFIGYCSKR